MKRKALQTDVRRGHQLHLVDSLYAVVEGAALDGDDRALQPEDFAKLHERFNFTVDAAAAPHNAKLPRFWTRDDDALAQSWATERVYCNPPYSQILPWVEKAWREVGVCALVVMVLPADRTEQPWWQRHVEPWRDRPGSRLRVEFLPGRLRFLAPGETAIRLGAHRPAFGSCLCIFGEGSA